MSEDAAGIGKRHHGVSKFLKKDRWREKLANNLSGSTDPLGAAFGKERDKTPQETQQPFTLSDDVNDFLKPSTSRAQPVSPKAPRIGIDVAAAQQWASSAASTAAGHGLPTPSSMRKKDYPRRRLNLTVAFTNAMPEVIGEGGDECEEAVAEISRRLEESGQRRVKPALPPRSNLIQQQPPSGGRLDFGAGQKNFSQESDLSGLAARSSLRQVADEDNLPEPLPVGSHHARHNSLPIDEPDFVPKPIKRTQTRFSDMDDDNDENARPSIDKASMDNASIYSTQSSIGPAPEPYRPIANRESFQLPPHKSILDDSPLEIINEPLKIVTSHKRLEDLHFGGKRNSLNSPILQEKISRMRAEEGEALHSAVEQDPFLDHFGAASNNTNRFSSSTVESAIQDSPRKNIAPIRPEPLRSPKNDSYSLNVQQQPVSQFSTPSPYQNEPTPDVQPQKFTMRKPIPPANINSQLRPVPNDAGPSPRFSPALNVTIPQRQDYFQQPNSVQPSSRNSGSSHQTPDTAVSNAPSQAYAPYTASTSRAPPTFTTPGAALGQLALDDFADRCSHMGGIFRLQAEFDRPIYDFSPVQWLRNGCWWLLRGRAGIEAIVRSRPRSTDGRTEALHGQELLNQPHVDLAKTWWILTEIIPVHPGLAPSGSPDFSERFQEARNNGDHVSAEFFESCDILLGNLKSVLGSMKRNGVMPPTHALIQGQDQTIWVRYPELTPTLLPILSGTSGRSLTEGAKPQHFNPLSILAVADTRLDFSYNRCFVTAHLGTDDPDVERIPLPAVVSVMRERNDWHPKVTICTQKEIVSICIQGDRKRGPCWQDVKWSENSRSLHVSLPHGYNLSVQLNEQDFKQLFNLYNHTFRVQSSLLPLANERVVYETSLADFQYKDSRQPPAFPPERVKRCRIRIFAKTETKFEGAGERKIYRGFRILSVTSPKNRVLGSASHDIGMKYPTLIAGKQDSANPGLQALALYIQEDRRQCNLLMVFTNPKDSQMFLDTLNGFVLNAGESASANLRLKSLNIEPADQADAFSSGPRNPFLRMQWQEVVMLSKDPETPVSGSDLLAPPEGLRIISQAIEGTVTDRVDVSAGELLLRLPPSGMPEISIYRSAQESMSVAIDPSRAPQSLASEVADTQRTVFMLPTIRTFSFHNSTDLHAFQVAVTGYSILYDGIAQNFTIARRRPVTALSRHKKIEAGTTRIQVIVHERQRVTQLLAFFEDMPGFEAMRFQLKGVDTFERAEDKHAPGRYGVRFVDAKFSLPAGTDGSSTTEKENKKEKKLLKKDRDNAGDQLMPDDASMRGGSRSVTPDARPAGSEGVEKRFVCLDVLDPPAENDDVVVGFAGEEEREKFLAALPAPPQAHRGLTIRRRI